MIFVHHLEHSRSHRIVWLLEELGLPYEIKHYKRDPKTKLAPPELKQVHPLGKSPVITDGELVLAESAAIIEYLVHRYGKGLLRPDQSSPAFVKYNYWMHYAESSLTPPLFLSLVFQMLKKQKLPFFIKPIVKQIVKQTHSFYINPQIRTHLEYVDQELSKSLWFVGNDFTAADIQMSFPLESAMARANASQYPHIFKFVERFRQRPAYQRAIQKGGPINLDL